MTNDIDCSQLGKRYRQKAHMTQEQLADKIDVATLPSAINSLSVVCRIAIIVTLLVVML